MNQVEVVLSGTSSSVEMRKASNLSNLILSPRMFTCWVEQCQQTLYCSTSNQQLPAGISTRNDGLKLLMIMNISTAYCFCHHLCDSENYDQLLLSKQGKTVTHLKTLSALVYVLFILGKLSFKKHNDKRFK